RLGRDNRRGSGRRGPIIRSVAIRARSTDDGATDQRDGGKETVAPPRPGRIIVHLLIAKPHWGAFVVIRRIRDVFRIALIGPFILAPPEWTGLDVIALGVAGYPVLAFAVRLALKANCLNAISGISLISSRVIGSRSGRIARRRPQSAGRLVSAKRLLLFNRV